MKHILPGIICVVPGFLFNYSIMIFYRKNLTTKKFNYQYTGNEFPAHYGNICRIVIRKSSSKCFVEFVTGYREIIHSRYLVKLKAATKSSQIKQSLYAS